MGSSVQVSEAWEGRHTPSLRPLVVVQGRLGHRDPGTSPSRWRSSGWSLNPGRKQLRDAGVKGGGRGCRERRKEGLEGLRRGMGRDGVDAKNPVR